MSRCLAFSRRLPHETLENALARAQYEQRRARSPRRIYNANNVVVTWGGVMLTGAMVEVDFHQLPPVTDHPPRSGKITMTLMSELPYAGVLEAGSKK